MNVDDSPKMPIAAEVWDRPDMRTALANHDFATVYFLLHRQLKVSQRDISRRTGQSGSEIYEIMKEGRQVNSYKLLIRIADGLGIPRGYVGLASDPIPKPSTPGSGDDEHHDIQAFLDYAAQLTVAPNDGLSTQAAAPPELITAPAPRHIGGSDVAQLVDMTAAMRRLDYQFGGGAYRDAVAAQAQWAEQLVHSQCDDSTERALLTAVADLHNLAGWVSFDVGMHRAARSHFRRALAVAHGADDPTLSANILYRAGRLHLHRGTQRVDRGPTERTGPDYFRVALRLFQLGQVQAQDAGCALTSAVLCANAGWAYALLGERQPMLRALGRAEDEFARADRDRAPGWVRFFGEADLSASQGVALTAQPTPTPADLRTGITRLGEAIGRRGTDSQRSRCFELTTLAVAHLRDGPTEIAIHTARSAVETAQMVRSSRVIDRLTPILRYAHKHPTNSDLQQVANDIRFMRQTT